MKTFWKMFVYLPFGAALIAYLLFVRRCGLRLGQRLLWLVWILFCSMKFLVFKSCGMHMFNPEFPAGVLWFWNWAYSGLMILALMSIVIPFRFPRKATVFAILAWGLSAWGLYNGIRLPGVHTVELEFDDLPAHLDGYRIAQVSDLHCSRSVAHWRTQAVVDRVNAAGADLICLTGDYVDGFYSARGNDLKPLEQLHARDGVYAITGNHEYYWKWREWSSKFYGRLSNVRFLCNECVQPRHGLALGGVPDPVGFRKHIDVAPDVRKAFAKAESGAFRVLMQHQPKNADVNAKECGVRLQLSGHTHGGIAPIFMPIVGLKNGGFVRGVYELGKSVLYVCPGCGQWEGFPMRFFNDSEITVIKLKRRAGTPCPQGERLE